MKMVMALILVIKDILLKRIHIASLWQQLSRIIDVEMIQKGQVAIFKMVQTESFNNEVKHLMLKKWMVPSNSSINQLDPFLNNDDIICVDGRLRKSTLTEAEQHFVILLRMTQTSNGAIKALHMVQED